MADAHEFIPTIEVPALRVEGMPSIEVAALRYFDATGPFAAAVQSVVGAALPAPLAAVRSSAPGGGQFILAWRSPTETWLLCDDAADFAELEEKLLSPAGCMVNQTGGLCALRLTGAAVPELLPRLGSAASLPGVGEARSSRVADLNVLILCVQAGEWILMVDRVHVAHLLDWIGKTIAD